LARRRSERAQRRIRARTVANALRLENAVAVEEGRPLLKKARHISQLEFLAARAVISLAQRAAGEILVNHFRAAGGMPKLVATYGQPTGRPTKGQFAFDTNDDHPRRITARRKYERAVAVLGPLAAITIHVTICDLPIREWTRPGLKNGDHLGILRLALDCLVDFYGLSHSGMRQAA
jgi:hypothetical protein